ncbi:phosphoglycerate mutase family protein [Flavobacterium gelidilacus]|jgi:phosphohistidine phosphatase|uniref:SixA phosphatase family protein n=1 Tax=Flavobacterium gelidilacus TaxID=206041 RepID=UPI0004120671|nr:phosphoglycerate mutase family protein [Flavobacterium gelidilacus]
MLLILIRHAKSSWKHDLIDHERPLSLRGLNDSQLVFNEIRKFLPSSYKVYSSSSKRTTQTVKIFSILNNLQFDNIVFKKELYTFNSLELEKCIKKYKEENLIIFGHNNAITDFVNKFGNYYIENVPTCGVVIIKFEDLNTISSQKGVIIKTIFPRDLK